MTPRILPNVPVPIVSIGGPRIQLPSPSFAYSSLPLSAAPTVARAPSAIEAVEFVEQKRLRKLTRAVCAEIKKQIPNFYFIEAGVGEDPDKRDYIVSNAKIEKAGFTAKVSIQGGIIELVKGYQVIEDSSFSNLI